jgi:hypothetical protein
MRWRTLAVGAATALLGFAAGELGLARAAAPTEENLVVVQQAPEQQFVDLDAPGPSPGDILAFHSVLTDTTGSDVGDLNIQCGSTSPGWRSASGSSRSATVASSRSTPYQSSPSRRPGSSRRQRRLSQCPRRGRHPASAGWDHADHVPPDRGSLAIVTQPVGAASARRPPAERPRPAGRPRTAGGSSRETTPPSITGGLFTTRSSRPPPRS